METEGKKMTTAMASRIDPETLNLWANHMKINGYRPATMRAYLSTGRALLAYQESDSSPDWLNRYFNKRRNEISASSLNAARAAVRSLFKFMHEEVPLVDYRMPPVTQQGPHPLPGGIEDVYKMIEAAEGRRDRVLLVALCGLGGLRISEALAVKPSDFNFKQRILTVKGKGEKVRYVTVTNELIHAIGSVAADLFADAPDQRMIKYAISYASEAITNLGKAAKIGRDVASHDLRMTYATHLYKRTHDIRLVQAQLGHSSILTTQLYVGLDSNDTRSAVQAAFQKDEE
jgi:integrase